MGQPSTGNRGTELNQNAAAHRRTRRRLRPIGRDESGQGVVEFALILPVLLLILVGILEFGSIYSKVISMRQAVREAGRQGSVAKFGNASCPVTGGQTDVQNRDDLICTVRDQAGVGSGVKVYVKFDTNYVAGDGLVICAVYPLQSLTGLFQPFLGGRAAKTKAQFRLEKVPQPPATGLALGGDPDPTGANWAWCT